jgi:hypothetical protein
LVHLVGFWTTKADVMFDKFGGLVGQQLPGPAAIWAPEFRVNFNQYSHLLKMGLVTVAVKPAV